jgi:hypothetical protein
MKLRVDRHWRRLQRTVFLLPNLIGYFRGYGSCTCGASWWWAERHNPGKLLTPYTGLTLCDHCYEYNQPELDAHNEKVLEALR